MPLDMFQLASDSPAMMPGVSDWMSLGSWRWDSHQAVAFSVAMFNAGARRYGQDPVTFPMMHCVYPSDFRAYTMLANAIEALAADPDVLYVSRDREMKTLVDNSTAAVNGDIAFQNGYDGTGIGIVVIDSGISGAPQGLRSHKHAYADAVVCIQHHGPRKCDTGCCRKSNPQAGQRYSSREFPIDG